MFAIKSIAYRTRTLSSTLLVKYKHWAQALAGANTQAYFPRVWGSKEKKVQ